MSGDNGARRFASPFDVATPPGCEGWEEMYPYYYLFSEERREFEEGKLWFQDGMHHSEPLYPFDTITSESWWVGLGQYNSRVFAVPTALGIDQRVLNGYLYISANSIDDPDVVAERVGHFRTRAGYYYENWDEIYANWIRKAEDCIERLKAIEFRPLPADDPTQRKPAVERAKAVLDWSATVQLQDGLAATVEYFRRSLQGQDDAATR